jgi:hypothetical protein
VGKVFRQLALDLFLENRVDVFEESCRLSNCALAVATTRTSPRDWAEALFPETLYPGYSNPRGESSTLGHEERFDQVFSISVDPFSVAIEM